MKTNIYQSNSQVIGLNDAVYKIITKGASGNGAQITFSRFRTNNLPVRMYSLNGTTVLTDVANGLAGTDMLLPNTATFYNFVLSSNINGTDSIIITNASELSTGGVVSGTETIMALMLQSSAATHWHSVMIDTKEISKFGRLQLTRFSAGDSTILLHGGVYGDIANLAPKDYTYAYYSTLNNSNGLFTKVYGDISKFKYNEYIAIRNSGTIYGNIYQMLQEYVNILITGEDDEDITSYRGYYFSVDSLSKKVFTNTQNFCTSIQILTNLSNTLDYLLDWISSNLTQLITIKIVGDESSLTASKIVAVKNTNTHLVTFEINGINQL